FLRSQNHAQAPTPLPPPGAPAASAPAKGRGRRRRKPAAGSPPRSAINHFARAPRAPPGILRSASGGAASRRPSGVRLSSASLLPSALPVPLRGRRGAFPTTVIFAKSKRKPRGFQGAGPQQARPPRASPQQAPAPRAGVPGSLRRRAPAPAGRRRVGSEAERRRGGGELTARLEAGGCVRGRARSRDSERALCSGRRRGGGGGCGGSGAGVRAARAGGARSRGRPSRPPRVAERVARVCLLATESASVQKERRRRGGRGKPERGEGAAGALLPGRSRGSGPPRPAVSEEARGPPAAAAPRALPRREPRRSRGRAAAAGRLVLSSGARPLRQKPCVQLPKGPPLRGSPSQDARTRHHKAPEAPEQRTKSQKYVWIGGRLPCSPPRSSGFLHQELPSEDLSAAARTAGSLLCPHLSPQEERPQEQTLNPRFQLCDSEHIPSPTGSPLLVKEGLGAATAQSSKHQRRTGPCTQPALVHWVLPREAGDTHLHGAGAAAGCWPQF
ncbi:LOW QUALITY PROTEIN: translation initiation factor IF-2-like, partial [Camelus ferus]|uniref:LOW QUALITY PROTEIN: translation initiation factor IF-2-like n=1 Tax=Camelus ferus TaxID=419612 RepID=A0A8B8TVT6_CAMFR